MRHAIKAKPLNDAQLMVMQVVNEQYNEQDIEDLRKLLVDFNHNKMQQHLDETVAEKGYGAADFKTILENASAK